MSTPTGNTSTNHIPSRFGSTQPDSSRRWEQIYNQVPLCEAPRHFANLRQSPFMMQYLRTVLDLCPRGGRTCESGIGTGHSAIWLSLRGINAEGFDIVPGLVERARQANNLLGGSATFYSGDLFDFYQPEKDNGESISDQERYHQDRYHEDRYHVIHHQGVLEHYAVPWMRAILTQQVARARHVVFSVPSIYYPFEPEFGDERLLPLEEWRRILEPFEVVELKLYGDPRHGEREHVLCVLRGQDVSDDLRSWMRVPDPPYEPGISAIVHTRNEERHIEACLQTLQGWTDEIIVCDMESSDETVELARRYTQEIVLHPLISNFDRARNVSALRARYRWVFYLDADERVPPALGEALRRLTQQVDASDSHASDSGDSDSGTADSESCGHEGSQYEGSQYEGSGPAGFEAMLIPFRHHFAGQWMHCLYPGYTAPRLFKNGRFVFNPRPHSGAQVDGRIARFPADNPDLALVHYSYDSLAHYLDKLNRYTDGEAANMHRDGTPFHWQNAIRHFVQDFQSYYDRGGAPQDGVHGFLYSFLSAFYRFEQYAKLYERRFHAQQLQPPERAVPASVEQVLEYALSVLREPKLPATPEIRVEAALEGGVSSGAASPDMARSSEAAHLVWSGPLYDPSGYGEESRHFFFGLQETGTAVAAQPLPWSHDRVGLTAGEERALQAAAQRPVPPGFVQVIQNFPPAFARHPQAALCIGRTMFETDRLPVEWVRACNQMDAIWVPGEFNRQSFADAGVEAHKLRVIPGCFDPTPYPEEENQEGVSLTGPAAEIAASKRYTFLSVFDWTLHKGWDVLLRAFLEEFEGEPDVSLVLKVWSTMGYGAERIREQAAEFVRQALDHDLLSDERIQFVTQHLASVELRSLYRAADTFVLPSRGEGWGRPYMEAMACGLPTIGTNWSGNTAFMTEENSYLLDYELRAVPERGWREIPTYRGHRWAEPDCSHLRQLMRRVQTERGEAEATGRRAQEYVTANFDRRKVARLIMAEVERVQEEQRPHPHGVSAVHNTDPNSDPRQPTGEQLFGVQDSSNQSKSTHRAQPTLAVPQALAVRWEGAQFTGHSLGHVNRELCQELLRLNAEDSDDEISDGENSDCNGKGKNSQSRSTPTMELSLVPTERFEFDPASEPRFTELAARCFAPLSRPAQVHVRHFFPPRFGPPPEGHLVLIQPWEYGYLPLSWIAPIREQVSEVWCYSEYVRQVYIDSGIPAEKLQVVPLGVDAEIFRPQAPPYIFTSEPGAQILGAEAEKEQEKGQEKQQQQQERFVFLFAGGTLHRKGIDILLEAYLKAFSAYDDVCMVIKDTCVQTVYRGQNQRERILGLVDDPTRPPLVYLEEDLTAQQMAGVYTAADCLVQPYRGEGFCLPALEAMACGVPVMVPSGGPTDDFVDESVGWLLPAKKQPFGIGPSGRGRVGQWECAGPTWQWEVAVEDLARAMRQVYQRREAAKEKGQAACERARQHWTWHHSAQAVQRRVQALSEQPLPQQPVLPVEVEPNALSLSNGTSKQAPPAEIDRRPQPMISLCMIVRDEERVLKDCLCSIRPFVDEIIVVDTGSTDRTVEIAEKLGAKVFHFPWCDDFSAARNESLRHATGDWTLWMDADDTIPAECGRQVREVAATAEDRTTGFLMQVHIPPAPGESGFTVVDHVKLFRNRPELRFEGRIHEQILEAIHRQGGRVERTDLYVVHSGYDHSPAGQEKKRQRDLTILEKDLQDRPNHPFVLFNIGMTAYHMKEFEKAEEALKQCLALSQPHESTVRKVYAMLAGCHLERGDVAGARARVEQGLELYPHDPELLFRAGIIYREAGDLAAAERSYLKLLGEREAGHIDSLDVTMAGFKARHNLALIYQDMGRLAEAEAQFLAAVEDNPAFVPSWLGLAEVLLRLRRFDDVRSVVARLQALDPQQAERLQARLPAA